MDRGSYCRRFASVALLLACLASCKDSIQARSAGDPADVQNAARADPDTVSLPLDSYEEALQFVRSHFEGEEADTSGSSWVTAAEYFRADGKGYLILSAGGHDYLFAGVPESVWDEFKEAPSAGRYYNASIRGRYRVVIDR